MAMLENLITECKFCFSHSWSVKVDCDLSLSPQMTNPQGHACFWGSRFTIQVPGDGPPQLCCKSPALTSGARYSTYPTPAQN